MHQDLLDTQRSGTYPLVRLRSQPSSVSHLDDPINLRPSSLVGPLDKRRSCQHHLQAARIGALVIPPLSQPKREVSWQLKRQSNSASEQSRSGSSIRSTPRRPALPRPLSPTNLASFSPNRRCPHLLPALTRRIFAILHPAACTYRSRPPLVSPPPQQFSALADIHPLAVISNGAIKASATNALHSPQPGTFLGVFATAKQL